MQEIIEMPKTYREQLEALEVGQNILIKEKLRKSWANFISTRFYNNSTGKKFTIRATDHQNEVGDTIKEVRIWRLQ